MKKSFVNINIVTIILLILVISFPLILLIGLDGRILDFNNKYLKIGSVSYFLLAELILIFIRKNILHRDSDQVSKKDILTRYYIISFAITSGSIILFSLGLFTSSRIFFQSAYTIGMLLFIYKIISMKRTKKIFEKDGTFSMKSNESGKTQNRISLITGSFVFLLLVTSIAIELSRISKTEPELEILDRGVIIDGVYTNTSICCEIVIPGGYNSSKVFASDLFDNGVLIDANTNNGTILFAIKSNTSYVISNLEKVENIHSSKDYVNHLRKKIELVSSSSADVEEIAQSNMLISNESFDCVEYYINGNKPYSIFTMTSLLEKYYINLICIYTDEEDILKFVNNLISSKLGCDID